MNQNYILEQTSDEPDSLMERRRKVHLIVLPIGIASIVISRLLEDADDPFESILLPIICVWLTISFLVAFFAKEGRSVRFVEVFTHTGIGVFFLAKFFLVLHVRYPNVDIASEFLESSVWVLSVFMIAFLIYDTRQGFFWSIGYYTTYLGLGLLRFVTEVLAGNRIAQLEVLIQYYLSTGAFIVLLFAFGRIKAQYLQADLESKALQQLAYTDFLTELPNRRHMTQRLTEEMERSRRYARTFAIILFDLDRFKGVNDEYGHNVGDEVLQAMATLVEQNVRSVDCVGRWGGEEFLIVAPEATLDQATEQAERLRTLLAANRHETAGTVTASFGVSSYTPDDTVHDLLRRADAALYRAKVDGRNRVAAAA